ncbi:hypothetical protein ABZT03_43195 [Streptomyces sp. NPDC005574]|uniref:hypothetical protein n=1 Tax=Streptomyces sp. NPDC005574 TaxID=3156891 RepID=UPI0033B73CD6
MLHLRPVLALAASLLMVGLAAASPAAAAAAPYRDPQFAAGCDWLHYAGGEAPPLWAWWRSPLCVEYDKRDITLDNGGAMEFLLAEPARFAAAVPSCRYYQIDHWSVQSTTGAVPWVAWDGQYWFDKPAGQAAAQLTNFRINGQTAGIGDVVQALRPSIPELADFLAAYGSDPGESGMSVTVPATTLCLPRW